MPAPTQDAISRVTIGKIDYECREHRYGASVLQLADRFSVTIPAPGGKVLTTSGALMPVSGVAQMGDPVEFAVSDPRVAAGAFKTRLTGVVTGRRMSADRQGGTVLTVEGTDLGWLLSSCGVVYRNLRGVKWPDWIKKNLGLTTDVAGNVVADEFRWGFQGVRFGNALNRSFKLGRQAAEHDLQVERAQEKNLPVVPVFHVEVGQTLDQTLIQFAKLDHLLVNVSADGWLQIFQPNYAQATSYSFFHYPAGDPRSSKNNMISPSVEESADGLYTHVECWSTVVDTLFNDPQNPASGRYRGKFSDASTLPFRRSYTFTDTEQMSQARVDARAKWQWQRGLFDSWTYTLETVGHSQDGKPFVEDTMCELHDEVYGYSGKFYVSAVEYSRKLARPGVDSGGAGTRCKLTLKKPDLLAA